MILGNPIIVLAGLPVIVILMYVYLKDRNKEPIKLLAQFFGLGIASCFLVLIVDQIISPFVPFMTEDYQKMDTLNIFLYAFLGVALIEEICKWIMVYFKGYNHKEFDEIYDIIVYSVCVSLGFAFFENITYILASESGILYTAVIRGLSAVPGHACDAIFMGYYLSLAKQYSYKNDKSNEKKYIILSIIIPAILHGIYDYCLMSDLVILIFVFLVFIIYLYIISIKKLKELSTNNKQLTEKEESKKEVLPHSNYCSNCGNKLTGPYCSNCGRRQE